MAGTFKVKVAIYFRGEAFKPGDTFEAETVPEYFLSLGYVEPPPRRGERKSR
ncbi:MAG: hypothetical protein M3P01_11575 [Actinomycetota bacterium]|nr:hypothetical protein [Actinomycetota bacterium]